ncbi:hypothetical protein [Metabacillus sediminilitoris]|uniref:Uncharacterized protein n=1 Tax=Metabacillus sediminilitoris TaxID=2567941 RepID=A0A4S4BRN1_9BACI|nr:hypothetical protein [Metabacillus sediminilitoris]QGQ45502.1 hypothetical protein GMB29_09720 [Metabacillus sediminilitoris]THF77640.1 hypothetical protein E6W99_18210 [Metabacillus sediminilitoris]
MSKVDIKKIFGKIKEQSKPIITTGLITGVNQVGNDMKGAVSGVNQNQSPQLILGKLPTILKSGAVAAGQEMMKSIKKNRE